MDTTPQVAAGKVLLHFTMSLDGFIAGPDGAMDWMTGMSARPGLADEYVRTTGAILGGRSGWDDAVEGARPYGGAWSGPIFVLTHHLEDAPTLDDVTFLDCDVAEALGIARLAAAGKNVEILSASIGQQLLALDLVDEIDLHIAPVLLGRGVRLFDLPDAAPIRLLNATGAPDAVVNVRYRIAPHTR